MLSNRLTDHRGLHLSKTQHTSIPEGLKHEYVIIPSTSAPSWGGYFVIDIREKNCNLHDVVLQFNATALTYTTTTVTPRYTPAVFWPLRIEFVQNNNVIDTVYSNEQFICTQLFNFDEQRKLLNVAMGQYDSITQRQTLASAANAYYVDLSTYIQQGHIPLLDNNTDIQIRVYMDTLANNAVANGSTGSPISTINCCNAVCKISRMPNHHSLALRQSIASRHHHFKFTELRYGTFIVASGVSSTSIVLSPITGNLHYLIFTVRPSASLSGDSLFSYTAITNFAILDGTSTNIVGGQSIPSTLALTIFNKDNIKLSYTSETANNANVYMWSFSASPVDTFQDGVELSTFKFSGNEQLQIQFTGSLAANVQVDVYAFVHTAVEYSAAGVRKISL